MLRILSIAQTLLLINRTRVLRCLAQRSSGAFLPGVFLLLAASGAHAACGSFGGAGMKGHARLPMLNLAMPGTYTSDPDGRSPVVGLWHAVYTNGADQSTFNDTFDTWHEDGTEFESAFLAPAGGNVCAGVWKHIGQRTVRLHHVGWLFDPSKPTATASNTFTLDEVVTVARNGATYSGSFKFRVWNLDGTPTPVEVTGTIAAARITVE